MAAANGENGRISVSRETLRAELAELELRLIRQLATRGELQDLEDRVKALEKWRYAVPSSLILVLVSLIISIPKLV